MLIYFRSVKKFFCHCQAMCKRFLRFPSRHKWATVIFFFVEHPDREMLVKKNRNSFSALKLNFCTHKGEFSFARFPDERKTLSIFLGNSWKISASPLLQINNSIFQNLTMTRQFYRPTVWPITEKSQPHGSFFFLSNFTSCSVMRFFAAHISGAFIFLFHFFHIRWLVKTGNGPVAL